MILLDALIAYLDGKITLKSLKTDVSSFLRKYALYRGIEIDDKFRNENGIAMQLWVMEYYFTGGKHGLKKDQCPKIFQEAIDLYHQDRKEFERILREAKAMNQNDKKEQFFVWLSSKVPASNLSDFYLAYDFIENYAKDSGILKTELISIKTKDELISLSKNLQSSSFFRNVSSRDRFYIGQILIYLEEYSIPSNVPVVKKEPVITNRAKTIITSKPKSITATVSPDHIDFMNLQDYVYTKPYEYIYAGETIQVRSWRMLYMSVVKCLLRDYPDKILNLKNGSITRSGAIDICDSKSVYRLRTAGKLGDDLYIEVNLSAKNIAQRIKYLLDICNVSYGNLVIRLKKDDTSSPMEQPKPKEKNVTAVGATPVDKPVQTLSKPPTPSSKQPIYSDSTQKTNHKSVDFTIPASYSFTLPIQFVYFGEVHSVKTWKEVYIGVLACLLEDYPNVFIKLKNKPTENSRVPIIFGKTKSSSLRTPALIGNNLYVETNRRTDHFIRCMKIILDLCKVDYENIIIEYDELSGETSEKGKDASKPEKTAMTKKSTTNNDFVDQAAFYTYLIDVQKISESTCRGYVSALKRAEQFAREERLASCQLLNCSQSEARKTIDALNGNEKFRIFNNEQHHRFSAAMNKLLLFMSGDISNTNKRSDTVPYEQLVLHQKHPCQSEFESWMKNQSLSDNTVEKYSDILKKTGDILLEINLEHRHIFSINSVHRLEEILQKIKRNKKFIKTLGNKYIQLCIRSFEKYISFRKKGGSIDSAYKKYELILRECFENGLRINSFIDRNRFRQYYSEKFSVDAEPDDDKLIEILRKAGVTRDDRIYAQSGGEQSDLIDDIQEDIAKTFHDGASCIYVSAVFEKYQYQLTEQLQIYSEDVLKKQLLDTSYGDYFDQRKILVKGSAVPDSTADIKHELQRSPLPMTYEELHEKLWYIPMDIIKHSLVMADGIVNVAQETYFYAPNLPVSTLEIEEIANLIHGQLSQKEFITDEELRGLIRDNCPSVAINTESFLTWGLRNALGYLLRERFSFNGSIISERGHSINMSRAYEVFCKSFERMTLDDLKAFSKEMNTIIYWESVFNVMIRVSADEFIPRDRIQFDVIRTDEVLDELIEGDYMPLKDSSLFLHFPVISVRWNQFVLECYAAGSSKEFTLLHASYSQDCCGAVVRKSSPIKDFKSLVVDVLAHSDEWQAEKDALAYLVNTGYLNRKRYSEIGSAVSEAKLKREAIRKNK